MSYTRLLTLILVLLLSACNQANVKQDVTETPAASTENEPSTLLNADEKALYKQAITALYNKDTNTAESIFIEFTNKRPEIAGPWANLALIQYNKDEISKANEYLQKALTLNPGMAQALNLKAQLEIKNGNIINAEKLYIEAINSNDSYANAHYNLALLYDIYLQDIKKAVKHYKRYVELTEEKDTATIEWLQQLEATLNNS